MSEQTESNFRAELDAIARNAMLERGLLPEFAPEVLAEIAELSHPAYPTGSGWRDLTSLPWCSIDNDDSLDLDQLTVATQHDGTTRFLVAVADVDALVRRDSAVDRHAAHNTTSVYTAARVFPMLPPRLSTDLTSLNPGTERLAIVSDFEVGTDGSILHEDIYAAVVRNKAKLAYDAVGAWHGGTAQHLPDGPHEVAPTILEHQLRLQIEAAQRLERRRFEQGALEFETIEAMPVFAADRIVGFARRSRNAATKLIENFMIAANGISARYLRAHGSVALRRVVRVPKYWPSIVELAADHGESLPPQPDPRALRDFLAQRRRIDPLRFPDLSLSIVKLLGRGEYAVERLGVDDADSGHFGLAVRDYAHSTAPNRRYPDLLTQRLLKATIDGDDAPYSDAELEQLAAHCTERETAADKVERRLRKSAAALMLRDRVGDRFDAIVTGAAGRETWVRVLEPPIEGRLLHNSEHRMKVGRKLRVRLAGTDAARGFIDFDLEV